MKILVFILLLSASAFTDAQVCNSGQLRLVYGSARAVTGIEGRVEICINGEWGTVCDDGWSTSDAMVACRQLGYPVYNPGVISKCCAAYGRGSGPIFLDNVDCSGSEYSLLDCNHNGISIHNCGHGEDAGVVCPCQDGAVRLINGLVPQEGTVEVCFGHSWRGICDSNWDYKDAFVVCRQLGYPSTDASAFNGAYFGEHMTPNVTNVLCYGNESQLMDCKYHNTSACIPTNTAGVRCQGETIPELPCFETIRLAGGEGNNLGRVEICSNGVWGTVCDGGYWDFRDAAVVCKQLGYQNPRVFPYDQYKSQLYFGEGSGPILYDDLTCDGTELALTQCSSSYPNAEYCFHSGDVGVRCDEIELEVIDTCDDGELRLINGGTAMEGRVEICISSIWGSVCDDNWDGLDAAVVCNQMGFPTAFAKGLPNAFYGEGQGPYHLDNVHCNGDESTLLECSHTQRIHDCIPGKDAGVRCNASACHHGAVYLVDGATKYEGRLEVCIEGQWTTVCDDGFTSTSATIVCRQMFGENTSAQYYRSARFGQGTGRIIDDVYCTGSESRLVDCPYTQPTMYTRAGCYHSEDISIRCYFESNCIDGEVRLVDGENELEGRVEVCINGVWGAIANRSWTFEEAKVVCIQIGYASEWAVPLTSSFFGRGIAPILISYIHCLGEESALDDCALSTLSPAVTSYYNYPVVGVVCQGNSTSEIECTPGDIRLAGGQFETEGRVEVCIDGFWGTVCEEGWDEEDALVFCRQSGQSVTATSVTSGFFGKGSGPIISHLACSSRESNILQCGWEFGTANCHHGRDVGVQCQKKQEYKITLATAAMGPFSIGTNVTLLCLVDPQLPMRQDIHYNWTTSASRFQPVAANRSFPNATILIPAGHPRQGQYYCHVYRRNFLLGIGTELIEVQGLVHITQQQNVRYLPPHAVTLSVEINPRHTEYDFRALTWFHNGIEVIPSETIFLSKHNTQCLISNTTDADSGVYEVKFTGLLVHPYTRKCEQDILALLRQYPIAEIAVFHLYTNTPDTNIQVPIQLADQISFKTPSVLPFAASQNLSLAISGMVHTLLIDNSVSTAWFFNGAALRDGITIGPLKRPLLSIFQTMQIENANILDAGFYEVALTIDPNTHFVSHLHCPAEYSDFVTDILGINPIVLSRDMVQFVQSEPVVQENMTSHKSSVPAGGIAGGIVAVLLLLVIVFTAGLICQKQRSKTSVKVSVQQPPIKRSHDKPKKPETVRYASATGNVQLGPNISYDEVNYPKYPGEDIIYDEMN